ncbi:hypothetical protein ACLK1S_00770 [Escherichia coli]
MLRGCMRRSQQIHFFYELLLQLELGAELLQVLVPLLEQQVPQAVRPQLRRS